MFWLSGTGDRVVWTVSSKEIIRKDPSSGLLWNPLKNSFLSNTIVLAFIVLISFVIDFGNVFDVDKLRNNLKITSFKDLIELGYLEVL
jgi:hypothetical protein